MVKTYLNKKRRFGYKRKYVARRAVRKYQPFSRALYQSFIGKTAMRQIDSQVTLYAVRTTALSAFHYSFNGSTAQTTPEVSLDIMQYLSNSTEFIQLARAYQYVKIKGLSLRFVRVLPESAIQVSTDPTQAIFNFPPIHIDLVTSNQVAQSTNVGALRDMVTKSDTAYQVQVNTSSGTRGIYWGFPKVLNVLGRTIFGRELWIDTDSLDPSVITSYYNLWLVMGYTATAYAGSLNASFPVGQLHFSFNCQFGKPMIDPIN